MQINSKLNNTIKSILCGVIISGCSITQGFSQSTPKKFTHQDTLRGSVTPERAWWNATYYHVEVTPDYEQKSIRGVNTINFTVLKPGDLLQIDLQEPMHIDSAFFQGQPIPFQREGNAYFLKFNVAFEV